MARKETPSERLIAELNADLKRLADESGMELHWETAEIALLALLADAVDRLERLKVVWAESPPTPKLAALSTEIRQLERHVQNLLAAVKPTVPQPETRTTLKNRAAAHVRWNAARAAGDI